MENNTKKNLGLQTVYQILSTALPLITAPYLARVLGATQLGVFSYTSSVVAYFTLLAMLGTVNYGTRSIAVVKDNPTELSKTFWEIYWLQFFVSFVALLLYAVYLLFICKENRIIALIQTTAIVSCFFDINWLFFGIENFKITVTRSIIIRFATVAAILLFVKSKNDLWLYTLLMLGSILASQAILWVYAPKYVHFTRVKLRGIQSHLCPNILLFIPLVAMSVYHTMDKTMLGLLSTYEQTGFYYNADKVINIPLGILTGIGTVMLPKMTALINTGKREAADHLYIISMEGVTAISCAMTFGIAAISKEFVPFFFGEGYDCCILLTIVLSPVIIIKGFSNTARTQYLIPLKMEKVFTQSVFAGAITNLISNAILIPRAGAIGAAIGTLFAECISCLWQFIYMKATINLKRCFLNCLAYLINGIIMFVVVRIVANISIPIVFRLIMEIGVGSIIYIVTCFLFWKFTMNDMYKVIFKGFSSEER